LWYLKIKLEFVLNLFLDTLNKIIIFGLECCVMKIKINWENCYGIGKLEHDFDFSESKSFIIYASNGTMKTSFAKTFDAYKNNKPVESFKKNPKEIKDDITGLNSEDIFVIHSLDEEYENKDLYVLMINKKLQKDYNDIYNKINSKKTIIIKKLKELSNLKESTIEETILKDFKPDDKNFINTLEYNYLDDQYKNMEDIKYSIIFNSKTEGKFKEKEFLKNLEEYIKKYDELIEKSNFFKKNIFDDINANAIMKSLKDNKFFEASHSVKLKNNKLIEEEYTEVKQDEELKAYINKASEEILNNNEIRKLYENITKDLNKNQELKDFALLIKDTQYRNVILNKIKDIPKFKKELWKSYFFSIADLCKDLIDCYKEDKDNLDKILDQATKETTDWQKVVDIFKKRFIAPFEISIENKADMILIEKSAPEIKFTFKDSPVAKEELQKMLSQGEKRVLYLLQIIFDVEIRKKNKNKTLFIIDDIADSFDYLNKYAIIEYLRDMNEEINFFQIILTHNYDFYRTVSSRVVISNKLKYRLQAIIENNEIVLEKEKYEKDPIGAWKKKLHNDNYLIAFITFARNISEYLNYKEVTEFLTSLLHIKENTDKITIKELKTNLEKIFPNDIADINEIKDDNCKILEKIYMVAEGISNKNISSIMLEDKICLSIATRLKTEEYLIDKINVKVPTKTQNITGNQTYELIKLYKNYFSKGNDGIISILDKVSIMTPSNIHLNSFMYEPIIDTSIIAFKNLYDSVLNELKKN
jgi:energy-coupling factor transporter ATP-binding protein EcfA2